jgi:tryptophan halogenase
MTTKHRSLANLVVLGGGAAGWMTALYAQKVMPDSTITLIESEEIGILGAGEGSTPHLVSFFDFLGIPVSRFIKDADAVIKNGIKFTNWQNDNDYYYHGFNFFNNLYFDGCNIGEKESSIHSVFVANSVSNESLNKASFCAKISEKHKVPFIFKRDMSEKHSDNILKFDMLGYFSLHFNASKIANVLKEVAIERGVTRIEGKVTNIISDKCNDVVSVTVEKEGKNQEVSVDFIFDCSGFAREIIGKHYKSEWISHSDKLPLDSAAPFFIPIEEDDDIPPYTEAIAMKYGWVWKIPTKERYGCGYVFDSSLISAEEAVKEVEEYFGHSIVSPRTIKFSPGYYKEPWKNNCVAIGLASGFIEPLEATSVWVTITSLQSIFSNIEILSVKDERNAKDFNKRFNELNSQVADFVYFHYLSGRNDTEFWKKFTIEKASDTLKEIILPWEYRMPHYFDFYTSQQLWVSSNWVTVAAGTGMLNKEMFRKTHELSASKKQLMAVYEEYKNNQDRIAEKCVSHLDLLEELRK